MIYFRVEVRSLRSDQRPMVATSCVAEADDLAVELVNVLEPMAEVLGQKATLSIKADAGSSPKRKGRVKVQRISKKAGLAKAVASMANALVLGLEGVRPKTILEVVEHHMNNANDLGDAASVALNAAADRGWVNVEGRGKNASAENIAKVAKRQFESGGLSKMLEDPNLTGQLEKIVSSPGFAGIMNKLVDMGLATDESRPKTPEDKDNGGLQPLRIVRHGG